MTTTQSTDSLYTTAARYGVQFTGTLVDESYHDTVDYSEGLWSLKAVAAAGGRISRLRILTGCGIADVSYCHATLPDGRTVPVHSAPMGMRTWTIKRDLIEWAKQEGVFAKGLGLLDENVWAVLHG